MLLFFCFIIFAFDLLDRSHGIRPTNTESESDETPPTTLNCAR